MYLGKKSEQQKLPPPLMREDCKEKWKRLQDLGTRMRVNPISETGPEISKFGRLSRRKFTNKSVNVL